MKIMYRQCYPFIIAGKERPDSYKWQEISKEDFEKKFFPHNGRINQLLEILKTETRSSNGYIFKVE